jgi:hypothetical protein
VQLINADGTLSEPLDASAFGVRLDGPVGGPFNTHVVLQTARIPLGAFGGGTPEAVRGVRFGFPDGKAARVYLANVRASLGSASLSPLQGGQSSLRPRPSPFPVTVAGQEPSPSTTPTTPTTIIPGTRAPVPRRQDTEDNRIVAIQQVEGGRIELELASAQAFQARGERLSLALGTVQSTRSRHPGGDLSSVTFTLEAAEFASIPNGTRVLVRYGTDDALQWDFGPLDKSLLAP